MAKEEVTLNVSVTGVEPLRSLLAALQDNFEELPEQVQLRLLHLLEDGKEVWNVEFFERLGFDSSELDVHIDGVHFSDKVIALFPGTNEVSILGVGMRKFEYAEVRNSKTGDVIIASAKLGEK